MQAGKEGKVVGVEFRQYALALSRESMAKMYKNKECVFCIPASCIADSKRERAPWCGQKVRF